MKKLRDIVEISPPKGSAYSRYLQMNRKSIIGKPSPSGKKSADEALKSVLKKMDDYYKKKELKELLQPGDTSFKSRKKSSLGTSKPKNPESNLPRQSKPLAKKNSLLEVSRLAKMKGDKKRIKAALRKKSEKMLKAFKRVSGIDEGVKKWRPGMTASELKKLKDSLKSAKPKATPKKKPKVAPVKKPAVAPVADDKHPLEKILKNDYKDVRAKLLQVHPTDRLRIQNELTKDGGIEKFMRGEIPFRKK